MHARKSRAARHRCANNIPSSDDAIRNLSPSAQARGDAAPATRNNFEGLESQGSGVEADLRRAIAKADRTDDPKRLADETCRGLTLGCGGCRGPLSALRSNAPRDRCARTSGGGGEGGPGAFCGISGDIGGLVASARRWISEAEK
ncbi:hypothetical protein ACHAWF_005465 [Thalassiosira exigua]